MQMKQDEERTRTSRQFKGNKEKNEREGLMV